ncbi:putative pectinesterase 63 [Euphorbia lathyris]|uniref:putative pectinesterase 63 n=1 Tax=Euphorbia lathyris TaxID=212925 RepID=UPI0033136D85
MSITWLCVYLLTTILVVSTKVSSDDSAPIPEDRSQVENWFESNVLPFSKRIWTVDTVLRIAERSRREIKVRKDGTGDFKTVTEAIASIPDGNTRRVVVNIGPGIYNEKILIPKTKPFVTLRGNPSAMAVLKFSGAAKKYGTFECGTLIVMSDYFNALFLIIKNSTPKPNEAEAEAGAQAVALRLGGDKAAIYNCRIYGYQDTLLDETGRHFFKSCFIQGTVDFIFGSGKSIYLQSQLYVVKQKWRTVIAAQAKQKNEDSGFSFVHCTILGKGSNDTYLGRAWLNYSNVVYSYSTMSKIILPEGWDNTGKPKQNMIFGEFHNKGVGASYNRRVDYSTRLSPSAVEPYLTLAYIQASTWLLPPHS